MNWSILQTGIGIELDGETLRVVCVKRSWNRVRIADRLNIPQYESLGPQECGRRYREFLHRNGLKAPWTAVALPRPAVLLRSLHFPKATEAELQRAIEYQLDSLHPFEEGSIYWAYSRARTQPGGAQERIETVVAIAEKDTVDRMAAWFDEARIGVSQFTVTTAALMGAFQPRLFAKPGDAGQPLFIMNASGNGIEIAGCAPGAGCVSRQIASDSAMAIERELGVIRSELRLDPATRVPLLVCGQGLESFEAGNGQNPPFSILQIDQIFPSLADQAAGRQPQEGAVAFAAAVGATDRSLPFSINLLPAERRTYSSPMIYVPAYALSGLIILLVLALSLRGTVQDWVYNHYLEQQIQALAPQMQAVETAQAQTKKAYERLSVLSGARSSAALPLEILDELTTVLPADVWIQQLTYDGETVSLIGTGKSSSALLQTLAESNHFENPQFLSAISRTADGKESFRIGVRVKRGG